MSGARKEACHFCAAAWAGMVLLLRLSKCEVKILQRLIHDESQRQIAAALGIAVRTVGTHLERIHRKLNVHSRTELIVRLFEAHRDWRRENPPPPGCRGVG